MAAVDLVGVRKPATTPAEQAHVGRGARPSSARSEGFARPSHAVRARSACRAPRRGSSGLVVDRAQSCSSCRGRRRQQARSGAPRRLEPRRDRRRDPRLPARRGGGARQRRPAPRRAVPDRSRARRSWARVRPVAADARTRTRCRLLRVPAAAALRGGVPGIRLRAARQRAADLAAGGGPRAGHDGGGGGRRALDRGTAVGGGVRAWCRGGADRPDRRGGGARPARRAGADPDDPRGRVARRTTARA